MIERAIRLLRRWVARWRAERAYDAIRRDMIAARRAAKVTLREDLRDDDYLN